MSEWELALVVPEGDAPRFQRIARALADEVRRGRLASGQRLPGSRPLAKSLGVHRNTVLAALAELVAQGWLVARPGKGTFVSEALPDVRPAPFAPTRAAVPVLGFPLPPGVALSTAARTWAAPPRGVLSFSAGMPDSRLFPVELLTRAWRRVLRRSARHVLGYGSPAGHPALRAALAAMLSSLRGVAAEPSQVLVTRGSQQALDLCARVLVRPGDTVAVEALGYRPAWDALRAAGARLVPLPVDADGLSTDALARLLARQTVRAVYVTPHHQYPTTVTLSAARRLALLELARRHRVAVLEDDYDHEFHYEGRPVLPLASADTAGVVVSIGTLSKVLSPGLRLGFVVAPQALVDRLVALRAATDRQGDLAMEAAVAELIEEGELQRHVRSMRGVYRERRDVLVSLLRARLGDVLTFEVPRGGLSLWARVAEGVDVEAWTRACLAEGVELRPGSSYAFSGAPIAALRLVFAPLTPRELDEATARMVRALGSRRSRRSA